MYTVTRSHGINTKEVCTIDECMSVRSWLNLHVGPEFPAPMICLYQGKPLLRAEWDITIIYADVVFIPLPLGGGGGGGGGKNTLALIGMAVITIISMVISVGYSGPAWAAYWGGTGALSSALGWSALAAGVMIGGSLLINALFPSNMPKPKANMTTEALDGASPTYSTSISQNQARLWQMIPELFGTHEIVPDLASQYFSEFHGNEQYVYALLGTRYGLHDGHLNLSRQDVIELQEYFAQMVPRTLLTLPHYQIPVRMTLIPIEVEAVLGTNRRVAGMLLCEGSAPRRIVIDFRFVWECQRAGDRGELKFAAVLCHEFAHIFHRNHGADHRALWKSCLMAALSAWQDPKTIEDVQELQVIAEQLISGNELTGGEMLFSKSVQAARFYKPDGQTIDLVARGDGSKNFCVGENHANGNPMRCLRELLPSSPA